MNHESLVNAFPDEAREADSRHLLAGVSVRPESPRVSVPPEGFNTEFAENHEGARSFPPETMTRGTRYYVPRL